MLNDPWTFLLLREALLGRRTFAEFRDRLGIATDVLSARLASLVEHGIMEKIPYRQPGQRTRDAYALTPAGEELKLVVAALQQWGDEHLPSAKPLKALPFVNGSASRVRVSFVEESGTPVEPAQVEFAPVPPPPVSEE
ncbi:winged helix-turn-helix transcriptional regulator [Streptomyces winkii]|uniref:winged helix-turn-helix transcriptional regulator n=1 Tax=Streptomyces winkii TaxID=3051178 RepID=UPI0028D58DF2|nr:helix-turn-helix domain-containing protein [Streptomyces sp. DSM 40971]